MQEKNIQRINKRISFGKVDFNGTGRRINEVTIDVCLTIKENGDKVFTASGMVWNARHTDCICGGQCLDEISKTSKGHNPLFKRIYRLWKLYHLNDMHPGTEAQEKLLEETKEIHNYDYDKEKEILQEHNLLVDNGYQYGTAWLYRAIPEEDLKEIYEVLKYGVDRPY